MLSWPRPDVPTLPSDLGLPPLALYDSADDRIKPVAVHRQPGSPVGMYVCGITPYDSTHLGHAATYLTFDLIHRYLLSSGEEVHYVQNVTDVDDPLFERAERDQVDWRALGDDQVALFRSDMTDLSVIPPRDFVGAIESMDEAIEMVSRLLEVGAAYQLTDDEFPDVYADHTFTPRFGYESRYDAATMERLFAERGGDPDRAGKRHSLDALLWRAHRPGEPAWDAPFGAGRPGWHIECSAIATRRLGPSFAIQGGGIDLRFPHHEYSAAHAEAAHGCERMAEHYVHAGMIGLEGTKMSKSLGNLVFVSRLTAAGHEPAAIRLALCAEHYRQDRDYSPQLLASAERRLELWRTGLPGISADRARDLLRHLARHLAQDLDTPGACAVVDAVAARGVDARSEVSGAPASGAAYWRRDLTASEELVHRGLDALLGVRLAG